MDTGPLAIKRVILGFLASWYSIVFLSNTFDLLKELTILPASFAFHSGNFGLIEKVTSVHQFPHSINILLLLGVILLEGFIAFLFWRAFSNTKADLEQGAPRAQSAYFWGISLWCLFLVFDEFFLVYRVFDGEYLHFCILIFHLLSYQFVMKP